MCISAKSIRGSREFGKIRKRMTKKVKKTVSISVETSGRAGSIAVGIDGEKPIETRFSGQLRHSIELFSAVKKLLEDQGKSSADVGKIYCVIGPGSFTGLP